jgi:hypothetical protein
MNGEFKLSLVSLVVLASRKLVASCRCGSEVDFQVVAEKTDAPRSVLVVVVVCLDAGSS